MFNVAKFALIALAILVGCGSGRKLVDSPVGEAPKLVVTKYPAGSTAERRRVKEAVVTKNRAIPDWSEENPNGVPGTHGALIGSFVTDLPPGAQVEAFGISNWLVPSGFSLGDVFYNLNFADAVTGSPIGETIGTLTGVGPDGLDYAFTPDPAYQSGVRVVNVYANIKSDLPSTVLSEVNRHGEDIVVPFVVYRDQSGQRRTAWAKERMQRVYVTKCGHLTVELDWGFFGPGQLVMGEMDNEVMRLKFTASPAEDMWVEDLYFSMNMQLTDAKGHTTLDPFFASVANWKLYQGSSQLGSMSNAAAVYDAGVSGPVGVYVPFNHVGFAIPRGTSVTIPVKGDAMVAANATSGASGRIALLPDYNPGLGTDLSIHAKGMISGQNLSADDIQFGPDDLGVYSNLMTIYATRLSAAWADDQADLHNRYRAGADDQVVAVVVVTNSPNVGYYAARIRSFVAYVAVSDMTVIDGQVAEVKLYKDSISAANLLGQTVWQADALLAFDNLSVDVAVGAGRKFIITMDTNAFTRDQHWGGTLAVSVPTNGIAWTDGVGSSANLIRTVDGFPLGSRFIEYPGR